MLSIVPAVPKLEDFLQVIRKEYFNTSNMSSTSKNLPDLQFIVSDLKWDSLPERREKARLTMFYRATHGLMKNTRNYHPKKFRLLACNTNCYMGTFPPSTVKLWNSLPSMYLTSQILLGSRLSLNSITSSIF